MKKTLMILTTAAMLSFQSAHAAESQACDDAPLVRAEGIADAIDQTGEARPLVQFYNGTAILTAASGRQLVELARLLKDERDLKIALAFPAIAATNPQLAAERSRAVRDALVALDAPAERVAIQAAPAAAKSEFAALPASPVAHCAL